MAEQKIDIKCENYNDEKAAEFYQSVNQYLDKKSGINGAIISSLSFQFFAYSKMKQKNENENKKQEEEHNINKNNRYLILSKTQNNKLNGDTIIAAIIQLESVIFLSTFNNIDLNNTEKLTEIMKILCINLQPIPNGKGLEICGDKQIIDLLMNELELNKYNKKEMFQNVYGLYSTKKYSQFCVERIKTSKLKIDNITDKNREELFGHLILGNYTNETHIKTIREWYPKFTNDVGLNFNENSMNSMIRNMKSQKVYFWGREKTKMIENNNAEKKENNKGEIEYDLVSLASITGYTPHMTRIGFVYTPQDERRKGYATHLVGCLAQIMEKEKKMIWIIADKTNIASNKAYTRIGFNLESTSTLVILS